MCQLTIALALGVASLAAAGQEPLTSIDAPEAHQGVAVDAAHVYAIGNRVIAKYDKFTGDRVAVWHASEDEPLIHLNSAVVLDGKLIAAHSNHSGIPMTSSVEIWDTETLDHIGSHSFGILYGSLTWLDRKDGYWYACFAHYDRKGGYPEKDHRYTSVVKFDDKWRRLESWVFPDEVLDAFHPNSSSGGAWGPDGKLYCTGHDNEDLFVLELPAAGSVLRLVRRTRIPVEGQAIAFDRSGTGLLYGIVRSKGLIVAIPAPLATASKTR